MNSQDLLNISISVGFIVLVGFLCWVLYQLVKTIQSVRGIADDIKSATGDIDALKNGLKAGLNRLGLKARERAKRGWSR